MGGVWGPEWSGSHYSFPDPQFQVSKWGMHFSHLSDIKLIWFWKFTNSIEIIWDTLKPCMSWLNSWWKVKLLEILTYGPLSHCWMGICHYMWTASVKGVGEVSSLLTLPGPNAKDPHSTLALKLLTWTYLGHYQNSKIEGFCAPHFPCIADSGGRLETIRPIRCGEVWMALEF